MKEDIIVSVLVQAYNEERWIEQTIRSIVNQKTNFRYELIVTDDFSTDATADIIRKLHGEFPDIIVPIYHEHNYFSIGNCNVSEELVVRGKYVATCDGDDYWCDDNKLQIQVDIMENNQDCALCTHDYNLVDENDNTFEDSKHEWRLGLYREGIISNDEFASIYFSTGVHALHCSSFLMKREVFDRYRKNYDLYEKFIKLSGDRRLLFEVIQLGNIYNIKTPMSCHRKRNSGLSGEMFLSDRADTYRKNRNRSQILFNKITNNKYKKDIASFMNNEYMDYFLNGDIDYCLELKKDFPLSILDVWEGNIERIDNTKAKIYWTMAGLFPRFVKKLDNKRTDKE